MRAPLLLTACLLLGCDEWAQDDEDSDANTSPSTPSPTPTDDAGALCVALPTAVSGGLPQVDGAFCFGVAAGASQLLSCAATRASGEVLCVDDATGNGYVARWTGTRATVLDATNGVTVGTIGQRATDSFDILVGTRSGVCTLRRDGISRAEFCTAR